MELVLNTARLCGYLAEMPAFSHENHGRRFFRFLLDVPRLSGAVDTLPVLAGEELLPPYWSEGDAISLTGELRSFRSCAPTGRKLILSVYCGTIETGFSAPQNEISLRGTLCRAPVFRTTPLGRQICDAMLCVPRRYRRSDYVPCIFWGRTAQQIGALCAGAEVELTGRMQSRIYRKLLPDGTAQLRTAYEVSALTAQPFCGEM